MSSRIRLEGNWKNCPIGLFEAFNRDGEMFGKGRVRNLIRNSANMSADEITKRINREPARFLGGKSPGDDLTFVIVKVK